MCQEALSDLKMAIRAAGEHKQRITVHIALDGLRLRDEKTGVSTYFFHNCCAIKVLMIGNVSLGVVLFNGQ